MAEPAQTTDDRLEEMVAAIVAKGDFPAAARVIQRLHDAVRRENCNALDVARVILDDPGLSSKVLRVVNSSFYRPRGEPVSTITRAVFLLGFEAIRDLATRLVLIDEVGRVAGGRDGIRQVLHQCLLCGSVSRALSAVVGYPNPEEAYLLGLFANWGQLCFAAYYPERYERALRSAQTLASLEQTLTAEFGLASSDLATAMLARWNFPPSYGEYFRQPHGITDRQVVTNGQRLFALVDVANDYAARAVGDHDPAAREEMEAILRSAETIFERRLEDVRAAVDYAVEEAREHLPVLRSASARPTGGGVRAPGAPRPAANAAPAGEECDAGVAEVHEATSTHAAFAILAEITRAILGHENINDTLSMILEGVARTGGFDVAFLALLNGRKDQLVGRLGYGEGMTQYLRTLRVPLVPEAGVLAESVLAREPRIVAEGGTTVVGGAGDTPAIPVESLVAHPLIVRGKAVGLLVAGRGRERPAVTAADVTMVQLFCNQAGLALDRAVG